MYPAQPSPQDLRDIAAKAWKVATSTDLPSIYSRECTPPQRDGYEPCRFPDDFPQSCNSQWCQRCGSRLAARRGYTVGHAAANSLHPYLATLKNIDKEPRFFDPSLGRVDVRRQVAQWRKGAARGADVSAAYTFEIGPESGTVHAHAIVRSSHRLPIVSNASMDLQSLTTEDDCYATAHYTLKVFREAETRLGALAINGDKMFATTGKFWPKGSERAQRAAYVDEIARTLGEMGA